MKATTSVRQYVVGALLGAAVVALPFGTMHVLDLGSRPAAAAEMPAPSHTAAAPLVAGLPNFSAIVARYGAAVVDIRVTGTVPVSNPMAEIPGFGNSPFAPFLRGFPQQQQQPQSQPMRAEGSGFIVSSDGFILTNAHVVANASHVTVRLKDRREFTAKVLGSDKTSDVAVLKIDATNLPTVQLGDSKDVQVGQWVLAIGAPFGLDNTATAGIVSAKGRTLPDGNYVPFIQTDVAVNPGNSGGPLFNLRGQVIGINSQIYSRSGGYMGVSFAIPIDVATQVSRQLRTGGHVSRAKLGVEIQGVNQALANSFGLKDPEGALVASVEPGSAAERAGIKPGDVILAMNGQSVATSSELPVRIATQAPGTTVHLKVWRNGAARDMTVKLGAMSDALTANATTGASKSSRLGLSVRPLTPDEQRQIDTTGGLLVEDVTGPAARAGIRPGDVVLAADGSPVKSAAQLHDLAVKAGHPIALLVQRGDARIFVPVRVG